MVINSQDKIPSPTWTLGFFFILSVWRCMAIKMGNIRVKHGNTFDTKKS